jgi:hypothetical protein
MTTYRLLILSLSILCTACPGGPPPPAPVPGLLVPCGPITGTVIGIGADVTTGLSADVNTSFTLTSSAATSITWVNGGTGGATDPVSGKSGTGTITAVPPAGPPTNYSVALTMTSGGTTITFTGTIVGPPTCTGSGSWTATTNGRNAGSGTWTIP